MLLREEADDDSVHSLVVSLIRRTLAGFLVLGLSLCSVPVPVKAEPPQAGSLESVVGPLFARLATLRGLGSPPPPPPVVIRSREETRRYLREVFDRKQPAASLEAQRKAMVALGLIPADFDLRNFLLQLLNEQAAAYYDPTQRVMVVSDWLKPKEQETALAHELVHALQHHEIPLEQFLAPSPGQADRLLARQALLEGEAVALSLELLLRARGLELSQIPDLRGVHQLGATLSSAPIFDRAPKVVQALLLFPYTHGLLFVHRFRLRHPWAALSQLYKDPPRSTAQILHPEKLLDHRVDPLPITFPDLRPLLPPSWQLVRDDELGEWGLGAALGVFLGEATGRGLANGWSGDRYQVWQDEHGRLALIYRVSWETREPAKAFARAYVRLLEQKHPSLSGNAMEATATLSRWQDGRRRFVVEQRGLEVLVLERVPAGAAKPIREALWSASQPPAR